MVSLVTVAVRVVRMAGYSGLDARHEFVDDIRDATLHELLDLVFNVPLDFCQIPAVSKR
jgi:hypothetical protein